MRRQNVWTTFRRSTLLLCLIFPPLLSPSDERNENWSQFCIGNFFQKRRAAWDVLNWEKQIPTENAKKSLRKFIARKSSLHHIDTKLPPIPQENMRYRQPHTPFQHNREEKLIFNCLRRPSRHGHNTLLHCSGSKFFCFCWNSAANADLNQ